MSKSKLKWISYLSIQGLAFTIVEFDNSILDRLDKIILFYLIFFSLISISSVLLNKNKIFLLLLLINTTIGVYGILEFNTIIVFLTIPFEIILSTLILFKYIQNNNEKSPFGIQSNFLKFDPIPFFLTYTPFNFIIYVFFIGGLFSLIIEQSFKIYILKWLVVFLYLLFDIFSFTRSFKMKSTNEINFE